MTEKERIKAIIHYICLTATRGSLEDETAPYFLAVGRDMTKVPRGDLEKVVYIQRVLRIDPSGIYKILVGEDLYKGHQYYSAFEVIRYVMKHTLFMWIDEMESPIDIKTQQTVRVVQVGTLYK